MMAPVVLLLTSLVAGITGQFAPGCSFVDNQCMYHVELGHKGQCDKRDVGSGDGQCCDAVEAKMSTLTGDVAELKTQVATLMSELLSSKGNLTETQTSLSAAELRTQQLLETLAQKEAELNQTQHELSRVLNDAGDEIRSLRSKVGQLTAELNTCRGTLGLATNTTVLPVSGILGSDVMMDRCTFEDLKDTNNTVCGYMMSGTVKWKRGQGQISSQTGPKEDHTYGTPAGHYMYLDANEVASHKQTSSSSYTASTTISMKSPEYSAAMGGYCIRFWYNMYGSDIGTLRLYAKIAGAGTGYPIFTITGAQNEQWHMAEVELDSEYTAKPFQLVFEGVSSAYSYRTSYSSYTRNTHGDIAVDDIYVYNTTCKNIPLCPPEGITHDNNGQTTCYVFHVTPATWFEAADTCRQQGATTTLVTVTSQAEQDFLVSAIKNDTALTAAGQYGFYTAGADQRSEHSFDWTDTGTPYLVSYSNWKQGQPNDVGSGQDCLLLEYPDLDFQWGDVDCDSRHPFICETSYPTPKAPATAAATPLVG